MKVAVYSGTIPSTTFIENLIEGISASGIEVLLFGKQKPHRLTYKSSTVKIYSLPHSKWKRVTVTLLRSFTLFIFYPKRFLKIYREVKRYNSFYSKWNLWSRYVPVAMHLPDIFHIQWAKDLEYWLFLKSAFGTKIILSLLGSHINYSPKVDKVLAESYRKNFQHVDVFHGVSEAIIREAQLYKVNPKKCHLIYTQLKPNTFEKFNNYQKEQIQTLKILSIGRHHWVKGYDYAIDAMSILHNKNVEFHYTIIADGKVSESLLYAINDLKLESNVSFKGGLPQDELLEEMQSYDVLLLPSLNEGIANVVVEAMAIGLLVVSTNCGGMSEIVIPNKTGWLCNVLDPQPMANSLELLKETPVEKRMQIAENAHKFVKKRFYGPNIMKEFIDLYNSTING